MVGISKVLLDADAMHCGTAGRRVETTRESIESIVEIVFFLSLILPLALAEEHNTTGQY